MMCETMLSRYVSITGLIGFDASPLDSMLFLKACCLTISVKDSKLRPNQSGCGIKCFRWASHCFVMIVFWSKPQSGLLLLEGLFAALMDISKLWWMSFLNLGSVLFLGFQAWGFFTVNPVDWLMCSNRLLISLHPLFFFSLRLSFSCKRAWLSVSQMGIPGEVKSVTTTVWVSGYMLYWGMLDCLVLFAELGTSMCLCCFSGFW